MESAKDSCLLSGEDDDDDDDVTSLTTDEADETPFNNSRIIYADEIPVEEESLEIHDSFDDICMAFKKEPMDGLISPIPLHESELEHLKSPLHTFSDCGYESHGSPMSLGDFSINKQEDDLNFLLKDLFPVLAN
jgi:hypothetical protein